MPAGMIGGRPAPASGPATRVVVTGSFSAIGAMTPRSTRVAGSATAPGTGVVAGQATTFRSSVVRRVPSARPRVATTTGTVAISTWRAGIRWMA